MAYVRGLCLQEVRRLSTFRAQRFYHICLGLALNEGYRNGRLLFHYKTQHSTYFRSIAGPHLERHPFSWTESYGSHDGIRPAISNLSVTAFPSYLKDFHVLFKRLPLPYLRVHQPIIASLH